MRRFTPEERRARLSTRHLLDPATRVSTVVEVANALVAVHSTDPVTVYLSVRARTNGLDADAIERELYEDRTVVRMLGMRRTLFVVLRSTRPVVQAACTDAIAARERARLESWIAATPGIGNERAWLTEAEAATLEVLAEAGEASTAELVRAVP